MSNYNCEDKAQSVSKWIVSSETKQSKNQKFSIANDLGITPPDSLPKIDALLTYL